MSILEIIGLAPSKAERELMNLVDDSYQSVSVVGRGTVQIDPQEVLRSPEFREIMQALSQKPPV